MAFCYAINAPKNVTIYPPNIGALNANIKCAIIG